MQFPLLGPCFFSATGDLEHQVKQLPADLFDSRCAVGDGAGVHVHQVVPAPGEVGARGDLDHWTFGEAVWCAVRS